MLEFSSVFDLILYIVEILGCLSFATSGAITAIRKKADILGVVLLTLFEVFGGGLIRDLCLNQGVPHIFWDSQYLFLAAICIVISIGWFIIARLRKTAPFIEKHRHDSWIYFLDAVGIAVFCVSGIGTAKLVDMSSVGVVGQYVFLIFCGVCTGVGGGMLRDVVIGQIPTVFRKHFYMTPCILGCFIYILMDRLGAHFLISSLTAIAIIVVLRSLATIYKWSLPVAVGYNELVEKEENKFEKKNS